MIDFEYRIPLFVSATVTPIEDSEEFSTVATKLTADQDHIVATAGMTDLFTELSADRAPIVDGKPRMLHIQAVMVHEGVNANGDGFYVEDLRKVIADHKLFRDGFGGMIDINHSFQPVGYWYDAELITDPKTNTVGILAKGAIWAWRFPEVADMILANQHRDGDVPVSMTCICARNDLEIKRLDDGRTAAFHRNPVFVATTILDDIPPGDALARGHADEDPRQLTDTEVRGLVLKAAQLLVDNRILEENEMLDELKPLLEEKLGEQAEKVMAAISTVADEFKTQLAARDTLLLEAQTTIETLTTQKTDLTTQIAEKNLALELERETNTTLANKVSQLETEVETYRAAERLAQHEALKLARLNEVHEPVRARLLTKSEDVRDAILERWAAQSPDEWEATKAEHALASEVGGGSRGILPGAGNGAEDQTLDSFIH